MERNHPGRPPADHLLAAVDEAMLARLAPEPVRIRALDLFLLGRVEHRLVSGVRLLGEVRGSRGVYRTVVHVLRGPEGPDAAGQCECPRRARGGLCKHAVALLYAWIHAPETFASVDQRLEHLEERPRGELLELIRRLVEEEPALLAEVDAAIPAPAPPPEEPAPAGGTGPAGTTPGAQGDDGSASRQDPVAAGGREPDSAGAPEPAPDGRVAAAPAGSRPAARPSAWLLELERRADPDPETLHRWADALEAGWAGTQSSPAPLAGPGSPSRALAAAAVDALTLTVTGLLWRQAGLVLAARARGEAAAARWLFRRWEAAARLLTRLEALPTGGSPEALVHGPGTGDPAAGSGTPGTRGAGEPATRDGNGSRAPRHVPGAAGRPGHGVTHPAGQGLAAQPAGGPGRPGPLRSRAAASVAVTAAALGPEALLAGSRFFRETGRYEVALSLARRALAQAGDPDVLAAARQAVAEVWLDRGRPERAVPYLAANFADRPSRAALDALEAAARAAGEWERVAPGVERHLEQRGDAALRAELLLRQNDWRRLAAWLEQPDARSVLPARLLVAAADQLRRPAPELAAVLYREAMARPDAGNPRDLAARWQALQHRLGGGHPVPPGISSGGDGGSPQEDGER